MREIHDHYFHEAKREGYRSRAAYKLAEIDDRKDIFREGDRVLDCGAAPGSWLQVAARRVGPDGAVVGVDLKPIELNFREPNIATLQADLREIDPAQLLRAAAGDDDDVRRFDVVLSDMAPGTTGDPRRDHFRSARLCNDLLNRLPDLLREGGNAVIKVFEGETYPDLLERMKSLFGKVKGFKPKASRSESVEMYLVAHGYRGPAAAAAAGDDVDAHELADTTHPPPPRRNKPAPGWNR